MLFLCKQILMYIAGLQKIIQLDNLEGGIYNIDNVYFG